MTNYTVYLGASPVAAVDGCEVAYECYRAAKTIAEITGNTACLVWNETGEEVESFGDDEDEWDEDEEYLNGDEEMGFDPYEGCYTYDC
jgi:hypothetical protein